MLSYYVFNIGSAGPDPEWWDELQKRSIITCGFSNTPGDQGEKILTGFRPGDQILAYANGVGFVGVAEVDPSRPYHLADSDELTLIFRNGHRHWLGVTWVHVIPRLANAVPYQNTQFTPAPQTRVSLDSTVATSIVEQIAKRAIASSPQAFWWVNHKQTFAAEIEGGYIWSPHKNQNGATNQTYLNLTRVRKGDVVISYAGGLIKAIGAARGNYFDAPKPGGFGQTGANWSDVGWQVPIDWTELGAAISPKQHLAEIAPLLPSKHSPLQQNGNGNQSCYLASISSALGNLILALAGKPAANAALIEDLQDEAEADAIELEIHASPYIPETEKVQLSKARRGQGLFRQRVQQQSPSCLLTGVSDPNFLIASHIKPWKCCNNAERLDGNNGLMLAPHVDKLFDRGWITFEDDGRMTAAAGAIPALHAWGIAVNMKVKAFSKAQCDYLKHHRDVIFRR